MLERLERAKAIPENQDPAKQLAIEKAYRILENAGVKDLQEDAPVPTSETTKLSEFIFDHPFFIYYPERGGIVVIKKDNRRVRLNYGENSVLEPMARNPDKVTKHEKFAQTPGLSDNLLKKNIQRLRYKLGDERVGKEFRIIKSTFGVGYVLSTSVDMEEENQFTSNEDGKIDMVGAEVTVYKKEQRLYIHSSGLKYFSERYSVIIDGEEIFLSHRQKRMFDVFVKNQNQVLSTQRLWEETRPEGKETLIKSSMENLINKDVGGLRKKIKDKKIEEENNFTMIQTVHGRGYMLVEPGKLELSPAA